MSQPLYADAPGSPSFTQTIGQTAQYTRTVHCLWDIRDVVAQWFRWREPMVSVGGLYLYIKSLAWKPLDAAPGDADGTGTTATYSMAELTATWDASRQQDENGQIYEESFDPALEFQTLNYENFTWGRGSDAEPIKANQAPGQLLWSGSYSITIYGMERIPPSSLYLMGCCNRDTISSRSLGMSFPPETLLYTPPKFRRSVSTEGTQGWTGTWTFPMKQQGWNKYWNEKKGWQYMYVDGQGDPYKSYPPQNLAACLPRF